MGFQIPPSTNQDQFYKEKLPNSIPFHSMKRTLPNSLSPLFLSKVGTAFDYSAKPVTAAVTRKLLVRTSEMAVINKPHSPTLLLSISDATSHPTPH
ncbi:hypothetical protein Hanom_Chr03g00242751 [Helianthus anomalus]